MSLSAVISVFLLPGDALERNVREPVGNVNDNFAPSISSIYEPSALFQNTQDPNNLPSPPYQ